MRKFLLALFGLIALLHATAYASAEFDVVTVNRNGESIPGVKVTVSHERMGVLHFIKNEYDVYIFSPTNEGDDYITTDKNGYCHVTGLPQGETYTFFMQNAPPVTGQSGIISLQAEKLTPAESPATDGRVTLTLLDENGNPLRDTAVQVEANGGIVSFGGTQSLISNEKGEVYMDNLPAGNYSYIVDGKHVDFRVEEAGQKIALQYVRKPEIYGGIRIDVQDGNGASFSGVSFQISEGNNVLAFQGSNGRYTFSKEGNISLLKPVAGSLQIDGVPAGTYTISEAEVQPGYAANGKRTIVVGQGQTLVDVKARKSAGDIEILCKDDETGDPVYGAAFQLKKDGKALPFTKTGEGVYAYLETKEISDAIFTTTSGEARLTGIPAGNYTLTQISSSGGYLVSKEEFPVVVKMDDAAKIEVKLSKSNAAIDVVGPNGQPVEGVLVTLKNAHGDILLEQPTNLNGKVFLANIPSGKYTYRISKIPSPYVDKPYEETVEILKDGTVGAMKPVILEEHRLKVMLTGQKGVSFRLRSDNKSYDMELQTNEEGVVIFQGLPDGVYELSQVTANEGYEKIATVYSVHIERTTDAETVIAVENKEKVTPPPVSEKKEKTVKKNWLIPALVILILVGCGGAAFYAIQKERKKR